MNTEERPHGALQSLVLTEAEIKKLEEKCGELYATNIRIAGEKITLVFRMPTESEYRFVFNEQSQDFIGRMTASDDGKGDRFAAQRRTLMDCCQHPGTQKLDEIFKKYPGLVLKLWSRIEKAVTPDLEDIKNG